MSRDFVDLGEGLERGRRARELQPGDGFLQIAGDVAQNHFRPVVTGDHEDLPVLGRATVDEQTFALAVRSRLADMSLLSDRDEEVSGVAEGEASLFTQFAVDDEVNEASATVVDREDDALDVLVASVRRDRSQLLV